MNTLSKKKELNEPKFTDEFSIQEKNNKPQQQKNAERTKIEAEKKLLTFGNSGNFLFFNFFLIVIKKVINT